MLLSCHSFKAVGDACQLWHQLEWAEGAGLALLCQELVGAVFAVLTDMQTCLSASHILPTVLPLVSSSALFWGHTAVLVSRLMSLWAQPLRACGVPAPG